jgi:hypothetical protein
MTADSDQHSYRRTPEIIAGAITIHVMNYSGNKVNTINNTVVFFPCLEKKLVSLRHVLGCDKKVHQDMFRV